MVQKNFITNNIKPSHLVYLLTIVLLTVFIFLPHSVFAGGDKTNGGNKVGSICYAQNLQGTYNVDTDNDGAKEFCRQSGGIYVNPGQNIPKNTCVFKMNVQILPDDPSSLEQCQNQGGILLKAGDQFPSDIGGASTNAGGGGSSSSDASGGNNFATTGGGNSKAKKEEPTKKFDFQTNKPESCNAKEETLAGCLEKNPIVTDILQPAIDFLAVGVGVVVVIMIIVGGIQYSTSGSNPQSVQEGKKKIYNAIFALVAFALLYGMLQWLIPGGIF